MTGGEATQARRDGSLLAAAAPMVLSRAGLAAMVVVDAAMVARLGGSGELAAATLAEGTFGRVADVFAAFMHAALVLVAAARAPALAPRRLAIWRRALAGAGLMGAVGLACAWWMPGLLAFAGQDPDLVHRAGAVILVLALGLPAGLVALACAVHLEGMGRVGLVAGWMLAANGLNIGLNALLIGGAGDVPALGAVGSAAATGLVRLALAAVLVAAVLRIEGPTAPGRGQDDDRRAHWALGLSAAGTSAGLHVLGLWLTVFAGWLGALPLAAYASCWILNLPGLLLAAGLGDAVAMRAAGQDGPAAARARRLGRDLLVAPLALLPLGLVLATRPGLVAGLYTPDPALAADMAALLPMSGIVLVCDGLAYVGLAVLRARRDVVVPTAIQIGTMAATPLLAAHLAFGRGMGAEGLVAGILVLSVVRVALMALRLAPLCLAGPARPLETSEPA